MKELILRAMMMTALFWLTGCASAPPSEVHAVKTIERFEGTLPCSDCRGVATDLVIRRDAITGAPDSFYLHETRIDAPGGQRINSSWGQWRTEYDQVNDQNRHYRLIPEIGDSRLMLIRSDGTLQPIDSEGRGINQNEGDPALLTPMTPDLSKAPTPSS